MHKIRIVIIISVHNETHFTRDKQDEFLSYFQQLNQLRLVLYGLCDPHVHFRPELYRLIISTQVVNASVGIGRCAK
ncbi:hypothetical protein RN001_014595 [Aquatica leii]|uniref:Uncharacterized protein n=1 Tax=Aquatica leii TaxID=1421715 RepID=A0AAN7S698_9COLE|nr:hypothetical protein RN001_014595 [Aquatica leii]